MEADIRVLLPNVDAVISEYAAGYLDHASATLAPLSEAAVTVKELLLSASGNSSAALQDSIRQLVDRWADRYGKANGAGGERRAPEVRRLEQTFRSATSGTCRPPWPSPPAASTSSRPTPARSSPRSTRRSSRRPSARSPSSRTRRLSRRSSTRPPACSTQPDATQSYEEYYMAVNPLQLGGAQGNKSKDIKIDNIDVAVAGTRILTDTSLTLAYGHRYGLVGNNGVGKSTLLRALSRREIAIPTHITILHVEQEVGGPTLPSP